MTAIVQSSGSAEQKACGTPSTLEAWGKASRDAPSQTYPLTHPLAHHCADVAAVFMHLCTNSVIANRLEHAAGRALSEIDIQRLAVIAFLHDLGKLNTGFQSKIWPASSQNIRPAGHVKEGLDALHRDFRRSNIPEHLKIDAIYTWGEEDKISDYLCASISHHAHLPDGDCRRREKSSALAGRTRL